MKKYYVNNNMQPNGDFEVHNESCKHWLPAIQNRSYLGTYWECRDAVLEEKNITAR